MRGARQSRFGIKQGLDSRYRLSMEEYDDLLINSKAIKFGTRNTILDNRFAARSRSSPNGTGRLYLKEIREYQREYEWVS